MKEINIARALVSKRREKGITQDDLAAYIGVSKASVSKWETGQSYPDITFLPQLAAYFNMSIDELMGYEPQMTKEDIRKLYLALSADFASKPFDEVLGRCREIARKYFSCFPLLFQIGALLFNYSAASGDAEKAASVIAEARKLFIRIRSEGDDAELARQALHMEAVCAMSLGNPNEALELLDGSEGPMYSAETLLASAYQMTGQLTQARTVLQIGAYKNVVALFDILSSYLSLCTDEPQRFEQAYGRTLAIAEAFDIRKLHPAVLMNFYIAAAQGYMALGDTGRALDQLEAYTGLVTGDIYPLRLKGDTFFNLLDGWFDGLALGVAPPRDEKTIRRSMAALVTNHPAFTALANERRFRGIVEKLNHNA